MTQTKRPPRKPGQFKLLYEIVQPNGDTNHLPVGLRDAIGIVRLSGDDRNDRDLRLVQGSALCVPGSATSPRERR